MFSNDNCPIQSQITSSNDTIDSLMRRIEDLEVALKSPALQPAKRKIIETELNEIKKLLNTNKEVLSSLHGHNTKSFALTACLVFGCFLVYGVYVMVYGA